MYLWSGHLKDNLDEFTQKFNKSIDFDSVLYEEDIKGSLAHIKMLNKIGVLTDDEYEILDKNLKSIFEEISSGKLKIDMLKEDIHSFIEEELTKRTGYLGKKLHTGRSRNDQCAVDLRLYAKKSCNLLKDALINLEENIIEIAKDNVNTVMPGFTHFQHAQITTFAHHIMSYGQMFYRDIERIIDAKDRMDFCPLGAGALCTTSYDIDRFYTAKELGFSAPTENSMDSVSDRDYVAEILFIDSLIMAHLSKLCEEIIVYSSLEFSFVTLSDSYSTGSSIMPQKKNPDMAELVRGKTGRVYGDLLALLTVLKGTPLTYNKDFQEDKEPLFDSINTVYNSLKIIAPMLKEMTVNKDRMKKSARKGFLNATDLADYLVTKGTAFRDAYGIVGKIVNYAKDKGLRLEEMKLDEYKKFSEIFKDDLYEFISLDSSLNNRNAYGGPAPSSVKVQIENLEKKICNLK